MFISVPAPAGTRVSRTSRSCARVSRCAEGGGCVVDLVCLVEEDARQVAQLAGPEGRVERLALDAVPLAFRDEDAAPDDVRECLLCVLGLVVDVAVLEDMADGTEISEDELWFLCHARSVPPSSEWGGRDAR
jgi:hypothetical protein